MTSGRRTLVALALALALGLVYAGWAKVLKPRRQKAKEDAKLIFPGAGEDAMDGILLRKQGSADVHLVRGNGAWNLVAPIQAPADPDQVTGLVSQLSSAKREEVVVDHDADLHEFGLDSPTGAVTFHMSSPTAKPLALFFGSKNPTGAFAYAMVDGKPEVFLVTLGLKNAALKDAADLRDKKVWAFDVSQVQSVDAPGVKLKRDKGIWSVTGPGPAEPAKGQAVTDWLGQLAALKADDVPSEDGRGAFGLASGRALDLGLAEGKHVKLQLGGRGKPKAQVGAKPGTKPMPDGIYVQLAGHKPVFHLPNNDLVFLDKRVSDLADRNAFLLPADSVQRFEVSGAEGTLNAAKNDGTWAWVSRTAAPDEKAFDFGAFVSKIADVQLIKRLPASAKPAKPARTVRFYDGGNNLIESASFGPVQGAAQVVFSAGKAAAFLVSKQLLDGLPPLASPVGAGPGPVQPKPPAQPPAPAH
jgi:hypothetical protein